MAFFRMPPGRSEANETYGSDGIFSTTFPGFFDAGREAVATYVCSTGRTSNANRRLPYAAAAGAHRSNSYMTDINSNSYIIARAKQILT